MSNPLNNARALDFLEGKKPGSGFSADGFYLRKLNTGMWRVLQGPTKAYPRTDVYSESVVEALGADTILAQAGPKHILTKNPIDKLSNELRAKINGIFASRSSGLDGNRPWAKAQHGFAHAVDILQEHGIELDGVVNAHQFEPRTNGTARVGLAFSNPRDAFSPISINNSLLVVSFAPFGDTYDPHDRTNTKFEVVAYLS